MSGPRRRSYVQFWIVRPFTFEKWRSLFVTNVALTDSEKQLFEKIALKIAI